MLTRREFGWIALAAGQAARINSTFNGVTVGVQTYSFRDRSLDEAIAAMKAIGIGSAEVWSGHVEPRPGGQDMPRQELRQWRLSVSMDHFRGVRKKFDDAGIDLYAYNYSFKDDFTDAEIARGFEMASALRVTRMTASANVKTSRRIDPQARKTGVVVGMHNHSRIEPNEFARPEDFAEAMKGMSRYIAINFDIGHFVAAGYDPIDFIEKHHDRIVTLHIKDRKKNQGDNVPFGQGDTPIKDVLQLLKKKKYGIPAMIEYEYKGADTIAAVRRCFEYCKNALA